MFVDIERSPLFAAPGFADIKRLSNCTKLIGSDDAPFQAENNLCEKYLPLAHNLARKYRGRGVHDKDLSSAAELGLILASRKFDPAKGAFGPYAKFWITGEITKLFKPTADAVSFDTVSLDTRVITDDGEARPLHDLLPDAAPAIARDLSALSDRERDIVEARACGEGLKEIGEKLGISAERVRQVEARALPKIKGAIASRCLSDLTRRGKFPAKGTRCFAEFRDREPPQHIYQQSPPSRALLHHRANARSLAALRGNEPLKRTRGPYGGPVIHQWGRR